MEGKFGSRRVSDTPADMLTSPGTKSIRKHKEYLGRARRNLGAPSVVSVSSSLALEEGLVVKGIPRHRSEVGESAKEKSVSSSVREERSKEVNARRLTKKDEHGNKRPIEIAKRTAITSPEWPRKIPREQLQTSRIPSPVLNSNPGLRPYVGEKKLHGSSSRVSRTVEEPAARSEPHPPRKTDEVLPKMSGSNSRALAAGENPTARAGPSYRSSEKKSPSPVSTGKEAFGREVLELEGSPSEGRRSSASGFCSNLPSLLRAPSAPARVPTKVRSARSRPIAHGRSRGPLLSGKEDSTEKSNLSMSATAIRPKTEMILVSTGREESELEPISSSKIRRPSALAGRTGVKFSSEMETAVSGDLTKQEVTKALQVPVAASCKEEIPRNRSESYEYYKITENPLLSLLEQEKQDHLRGLNGRKMHRSPGKSISASLILSEDDPKSSLLTRPKLTWKASYKREHLPPVWDPKSSLMTHPKLKWKASYKREQLHAVSCERLTCI